MHTLLLLLAIARPMETIEEWTLLDSAPLEEALTARAVYRRDDGPELELPAVFDAIDAAAPQPSVELVGTIAPLSVYRINGRWRARLPPEPGPRNARVVVRSIRPVSSLKMFRAQWPITRGDASRRVAIVPRGWMEGVSAGWTCADDSVSTVACVTIDTAPNPLHVRVPAAPMHRANRALSALLAVIALAFVVGSRDATVADRRARGAALAAAAVPGAGLGLTLVGARLISWAFALNVACALAMVGAALALRSKRALTAASGALAVLPLVAVFDGRPRTSVVLSFVALAVIALAGTSSQVASASDDKQT